MPLRGGAAKAGAKAVHPLNAEGDLGKQHEDLAAPLEGLGDGLEIDLGLARSGDAVEERNGEPAPRHHGLQGARRRRLIGRQGRARAAPVGRRRGRPGGQAPGHQDAGPGEAPHHRRPDAGGARQFGRRTRRAIRQDPDHAAPRRRETHLGHRLGQGVSGYRARRIGGRRARS